MASSSLAPLWELWLTGGMYSVQFVPVLWVVPNASARGQEVWKQLHGGAGAGAGGDDGRAATHHGYVHEHEAVVLGHDGATQVPWSPHTVPELSSGHT